MIVILNEKDEPAAQGHRTVAAAVAWIEWALTVRPDAKYRIMIDGKEFNEPAAEDTESTPET